MRTSRRALILLSLGVLPAATVRLTAQALEPLPAGEAGLAQKYPEDGGIEKDPAVVFAHGFEDVLTVDDLRKIDYLTIGGYINPNKVRTNRIWFDDVVAATSYIGPQPSSKR